MSYFSEVYGDPELSAKAKLVLVYLHDRPTGTARVGTP